MSDLDESQAGNTSDTLCAALEVCAEQSPTLPVARERSMGSAASELIALRRLAGPGGLLRPFVDTQVMNANVYESTKQHMRFTASMLDSVLAEWRGAPIERVAALGSVQALVRELSVSLQLVSHWGAKANPDPSVAEAVERLRLVPISSTISAPHTDVFERTLAQVRRANDPGRD